MTPRPTATLAVSLFVAGLGCVTADGPADLVLHHGVIVTMDAARPEAEALAIVGEKIVAVGSDDEIAARIGPATTVIDLDGKLAVPGLIEGHGHFMGLGRAKMILDLRGARTWDDIVEMVAFNVRDTEPGAWILGHGWHQEKWDTVPSPNVEGLPTHQGLTRVSPDNPVFLTHASDHASFANARALAAAGITRETPDPPGGQIVRDADGDPTGMLRENAQDAVEDAIARHEAERSATAIDAETRRMVELASREALSKGITTFHDAGSSFQTIDFLKRMADAGELPIRLYVMVRYESNESMAEKLPKYRMINAAGGFLTVRAIKRQVDGALGAHGAWLLEPYDDMRETTGLNLEPIPDIMRTAELAIQHGFQLNTHAIGDRANRKVLDIYEQVFREHPEARDVRWRIEHAQHLHPDDIPRFAKLGVIASMQGVHATSDGPWVLKRLGPKRAREGAYVWRKLMDAGVVVTNGTDTPVEDVDPIPSFYASVTRKMADGTAFYPEQRMSRVEALRSYTLNNAYAAFEEDIKGSLTPGKLADITVLSKDIMTVPDDEILDAEVVYTIVGGQIAYERGIRD